MRLGQEIFHKTPLKKKRKKFKIIQDNAKFQSISSFQIFIFTLFEFD